MIGIHDSRCGDVRSDGDSRDLQRFDSYSNGDRRSRSGVVASRQSWFDQHSPRRRPLWVLERGGQIAGWLSFQSFYGRPAYQGTAEVSVYVSPTHRRSGIGRELVGEAMERAPSLGLRTLLGFIFEHNLPSLKLFESFGFQRWGNLPRVADLDGVERGLIIVGRRLD